MTFKMIRKSVCLVAAADTDLVWYEQEKSEETQAQAPQAHQFKNQEKHGDQKSFLEQQNEEQRRWNSI